MNDEIAKGLEGVFVAESGLSAIDGDAGRLVYRGYDIEDLAREATYEEVLYLLWEGSLPTRADCDEFTEALARKRPVEDSILDIVQSLAHAGERPMAALRTGVSLLSADGGEDVESSTTDATSLKGQCITAKMPTVLAAFERCRNGKDPIEPRDDLGHAANFLYMLTGDEPDDVAAETFDMALILHADHGLNASTFTTMVIASTLADPYSSVTGGIGALSGPLHGGANQDVMEMLVEIDESDQAPIEWVREAIENDRRIPGWGHRVYNVTDPRARILKEKARVLGETSGDEKWYEYTTTIEQYLSEEEALIEKRIAPNVDFYSGSVYYQLGIPIDMYTPIFALSRVGGWIAHIIEYQADNRLIRPRARYVGPESEQFVPIEDR